MTEVHWRKFRSHSGCLVRGTEDFDIGDGSFDDKDHLTRAAWLTAQIEGGGTFGTINSYDGTAMSAGLEHRIAIYPRSMEQGTLWPLLRELEKRAHCEALNDLWEKLKTDAGWFVDQSGVLRKYMTAEEVSAKEIRNEFTPKHGRVPRSGENWEQAKNWALAFHRLFASPETFKVQVDALIESLAKLNRKNELEAYHGLLGPCNPFKLQVDKDISYEADLAFCVYHSYSVNAPGMARRRLEDAKRLGYEKNWPKELIWTLATTRYGRWSDTADNRNRYDATRINAKKSGLWPEELFEGPDAIMPTNIG